MNRSHFYGDDGPGQGHPGNDVDISQRYAQSEADEHMAEAERMTRDLERRGIRLGAARDKFVSDLAEQFRGRPAQPARGQEPQEEPSLSRAADDKFWNSPDEQEKAWREKHPKYFKKGESN